MSENNLQKCKLSCVWFVLYINYRSTFLILNIRHPRFKDSLAVFFHFLASEILYWACCHLFEVILGWKVNLISIFVFKDFIQKQPWWFFFSILIWKFYDTRTALLKRICITTWEMDNITAIWYNYQAKMKKL